jgi:hypothetical protein
MTACCIDAEQLQGVLEHRGMGPVKPTSSG